MELTLYDKKHDFVAGYGKELLEFVPKNDRQAILDLGYNYKPKLNFPTAEDFGKLLEAKGFVVTVNAHSYIIITAQMPKSAGTTYRLFLDNQQTLELMLSSHRNLFIKPVSEIPTKPIG